MDWKTVLGTIAPTAATLLGGPLAGLAVDALGKALGMEQPTVETVKAALTTGQLTGDQIVAVKQAEQALVLRMRELDIEADRLEMQDRDSARVREASVKDTVNAWLAAVIVGSFVLMVFGTLLGWTKAETVLAGTLIGYLSAKAEQVLAYYFGSTKGSAQKTKLLAEQGKDTA